MIFRSLVLVCLAAAAANITEACQPGPPETLRKALASADAVFTGTVTGIVRKDIQRLDGFVAPGVEVEVKTTKAWKGDIVGTVRVGTGTGGGDCGYPFEKGQGYLIYAYRTQDGHWYTDVARNTAPLKESNRDILELEGRLPLPKGPARQPTLKLKARTHDAKSDYYTFTLHNRLHERIFCFHYGLPVYLIQVRKRGQWLDYGWGYRSATDREPTLAEAKRNLKRWRAFYKGADSSFPPAFLNPLASCEVVVMTPTFHRVWRAGFQYVSERELDAGARIQDSKHVVWSDPIKSPAR